MASLGYESRRIVMNSYRGTRREGGRVEGPDSRDVTDESERFRSVGRIEPSGHRKKFWARPCTGQPSLDFGGSFCFARYSRPSCARRLVFALSVCSLKGNNELRPGGALATPLGATAPKFRVDEFKLLFGWKHGSLMEDRSCNQAINEARVRESIHDGRKRRGVVKPRKVRTPMSVGWSAERPYVHYTKEDLDGAFAYPCQLKAP